MSKIVDFEKSALLQRDEHQDEPSWLVTELKQRLHLGSDYQVAKLLGVTRASVSKWQRGQAQMSDATALKIAELLDADPVWVLLRVWKSRSDSPGARFVAQRLLNEIRGKGRALVHMRRQTSILLGALALTALVSPAPSEACPQPAAPSMYITLNRRRTRRDRRERRRREHRSVPLAVA